MNTTIPQADSILYTQNQPYCKVSDLLSYECHSYNEDECLHHIRVGVCRLDGNVCKPACECGQKLKVPVFKFLKSAIIRKWGLEFYNQLNQAFEQFFSKK